MLAKRLAITGIGPVAPGATGVENFDQAVFSGRSNIAPLTLFDPSGFDCTTAGQLIDFSARDFVPKSYRKAVKVMARDIEIAVAAADVAVRDAGLVTAAAEDANATTTYPSARLGCNIGAGLICADLDELGQAVNSALADGRFDLRAWGDHGMNNLTPLWLLKYLPNMLSCHVTIIHGARGPSNCITCGAASGLLAIGEASRSIAEGRADASLAGGAESKVNPMGLLRQTLLKRLALDGTPRPFDARHSGTIIGEGGGVVVLETLDAARNRGAKLYAEPLGFGAACDPAGATVGSPNVGSMDIAIRRALNEAALKPEQVDLIVAQGTGVPAEDAAESAAWHAALGDSAAKIPAVSLTGAFGSLFVGFGALAVAAAALAMARQAVPPTAGFDTLAAGCKLNLSGHARPARIDTAVVAAFDTAGQSAAVVLKRCQS